jgi:DNA-binding MarR family transcriptional regulator
VIVSPAGHFDELLHRLDDLARMLRTIRQRRATERPEIPFGMLGILRGIEQLTDRAGRHGEEAVGCHAKELAETVGLDPSTVSRVVTALVARGLVDRRTDPADRRASILVLTDAGRAALADAQDWYADLVVRALADWQPADVAVFTSVLGRFTTDILRSLDEAAAVHNDPHDTREASR